MRAYSRTDTHWDRLDRSAMQLQGTTTIFVATHTHTHAENIPLWTKPIDFGNRSTAYLSLRINIVLVVIIAHHVLHQRKTRHGCLLEPTQQQSHTYADAAREHAYIPDGAQTCAHEGTRYSRNSGLHGTIVVLSGCATEAPKLHRVQPSGRGIPTRCR